jgi:hypothetical protein
LLLLVVLNGAILVLLLKERNKTQELSGLLLQTDKDLAYITEEVPGQTIRSTQSSLIAVHRRNCGWLWKTPR